MTTTNSVRAEIFFIEECIQSHKPVSIQCSTFNSQHCEQKHSAEHNFKPKVLLRLLALQKLGYCHNVFSVLCLVYF